MFGFLFHGSFSFSGLDCPVLSRRFDVCRDSVVLGERGGLAQMLMNLVVNAAEALGGRPGTIRIATEHVQKPAPRWDKAHGSKPVPGNWLELEVIDDGSGVEPANLERIFEPFQRIASTYKSQSLGLGLYIVREIVQAHGGSIMIESPDSGGGAAFVVRLPVEQQTSEASAQES